MENWPKNLSGLEQQREGACGVDKRLAHLICGDKKSPRASRIHFTRQATCQVPGQSRKMWKMRDMFVHDVNKASHSGASVLCNDSKLGDLLTIDFLLVLVDFAACYQPVAYQPQQEQQLRLLRFAGHLDWGRTRFALWHIHKSHLQSSAVCAKNAIQQEVGKGEGVISN